MAKQTINVGTRANDGTGDSIRRAAIKINENFTENYASIQTLQNSVQAITFTQGVQGIQGPQGIQGRQGTQGIIGIGVQGIQGRQGVQGIQGIQGGQGNQGIQGVQGSRGSQGIQGRQGIQGDQGILGNQGVQGIQGNQGVQGVQGVQGNQGRQGVQGTTGILGNQGIQGITGTPGNIGSQGIQGTAGNQGTGFIGSRTTSQATTPVITNNNSANLEFYGFKGYVLYKIQTSEAAWVRLYVSNAARTADASRTQGTDPAYDAGVITEVITTGLSTVIMAPAVHGFNDENPVTDIIPVTVTNLSGNAATITVTLTLLQAEA